MTTLKINLNKENLSKQLESTKSEKPNSKKGKAKKPISKSPKGDTKEIDEKNLQRHVEAVVSKREVKWIYPAGCDDTVARKKFRQTSRDKIRKLERDIKSSKDEKATAKLNADLKKLRKELLHNPTDVV